MALPAVIKNAKRPLTHSAWVVRGSHGSRGGLYGEFETSGDDNLNVLPTDSWTSRGRLSDCDVPMLLYCFEE